MVLCLLQAIILYWHTFPSPSQSPATLSVAFAGSKSQSDTALPVTADNFRRAESDMYFNHVV